MTPAAWMGAFDRTLSPIRRFSPCPALCASGRVHALVGTRKSSKREQHVVRRSFASAAGRGVGRRWNVRVDVQRSLVVIFAALSLLLLALPAVRTLGRRWEARLAPARTPTWS